MFPLTCMEYCCMLYSVCRERKDISNLKPTATKRIRSTNRLSLSWLSTRSLHARLDICTLILIPCHECFSPEIRLNMNNIKQSKNCNFHLLVRKRDVSSQKALKMGKLGNCSHTLFLIHARLDICPLLLLPCHELFSPEIRSNINISKQNVGGHVLHFLLLFPPSPFPCQIDKFIANKI